MPSGSPTQSMRSLYNRLANGLTENKTRRHYDHKLTRQTAGSTPGKFARARNAAKSVFRPRPRPNLLLDLPYDILVVISGFLAAQDILNISATCTSMKQTCASRSVWHQVMLRILSSMPLPHISTALPSMSAPELKHRALAASTVQKRWHHHHRDPRPASTFPCSDNTWDFKLLPGGRWILLVLHDGTLQLQEVGAATPRVVVEAPEEAVDMTRWFFPTSRGDMIVLLQVDHNWVDRTFFVYRTNTTTPALQLLATEHYVSCHIQTASIVDGLMVVEFARDVEYGDTTGTKRWMYARTLTAHPARHIRLEYPAHGSIIPATYSTVTLLSRNHFLMSNYESAVIYEFPNPRPMVDPTTPETDTITLTANLTPDTPVVFPPDHRIVTDDYIGRIHGPVIRLTKTEAHVIFRDATRTQWTVRAFGLHVDGPGSVPVLDAGYTHALWEDPLCPLKFRTCTFHAGGEAPEIGSFLARGNGVNENDNVGRVRFDEGSGRICMLVHERARGRYTPREPVGRRNVVVVDLFQSNDIAS